jgi:predicted nucleotidyltransferase
VDQQRLHAIAGRYGVALLLQHGSTVTGQTHAGSDLDLAVLFDRGPIASQVVEALTSDLQAVFPGQDVDLVVANHADHLLLRRIVEQPRLLYGAPVRLQALQLYAFKRHQDHRRFLRLEREYVRRQIEAVRT